MLFLRLVREQSAFALAAYERAMKQLDVVNGLLLGVFKDRRNDEDGHRRYTEARDVFWMDILKLPRFRGRSAVRQR